MSVQLCSERIPMSLEWPARPGSLRSRASSARSSSRSLAWSNPLAWWWSLLTLVSGANIAVWFWLYRDLHQQPAIGSAPGTGLMLLLCAGYVFGCAFRSILPRADVQRICLFDTWLSSIAVGRSVATVAELCFAAQWALLLREYGRAGGSAFGRAAAPLTVPRIAVAECCSWYSVLPTSNIGHVAEESIWGLCGALITASLIAVVFRSQG